MLKSWQSGAVSSTALRVQSNRLAHVRSRAVAVVCLLPKEARTETRKVLFRAFLQHQPSSPQAQPAALFVVPRADRSGSAISNHASGSIAVPPASGFLQVSLSKVLRPACTAAPRHFPPKHSRSRLTTTSGQCAAESGRLAVSPLKKVLRSVRQSKNASVLATQADVLSAFRVIGREVLSRRDEIAQQIGGFLEG